jgi:hypothetical protein
MEVFAKSGTVSAIACVPRAGGRSWVGFSQTPFVLKRSRRLFRRVELVVSEGGAHRVEQQQHGKTPNNGTLWRFSSPPP